MSRESDILEGMHYEVLEKWIESGRVDVLPEGMEEYLKQLRAVLGFHNRSFNKNQIIKRLKVAFNLNYHQAKSRYIDAINFFYLDKDISYESYMNVYADKLDKISDLITQSSTTPEQLMLAIKPIKEAALIREKVKPKDKLPEEIFNRPNKIYTLQLEDVGVHEKINRNHLANMIDEMKNLEESEKTRIKQEASLEPRQLFESNEQETED